MDKKRFLEIWNNSIDSALKETSTSSSKFRIEPVPPKEFFEVWLGQPLFPQQYEILDQVFTNNYKDWNRDIREVLLKWGEGCISKDTRIRDIETGEDRTISQWTKMQKNFHVLAYDFETASWKKVLADVPYKKGHTKIYKVTIKNPNQKKSHIIKCTKEHKFYTPFGWKELKDLKEGDLVATYNPAAALVSSWNKDTRKKMLGNPEELNPNFGKKASITKRRNISLGIRNSKKYQNWLVSDKRKKLFKKYSLIRRINNYKRNTHIFSGSGRCKWETYYSPIAGTIKIQGEFEKRFARYLDRKKYNWRRNTKWFYYKDEQGRTRQYQPDFLVIHDNGTVTFYEVKGYLQKVDLLKLEAVRQQGFHIVLVQKKLIKKLSTGEIKELPKNDAHLIFKPIEKIEFIKEDDYYDFNVPVYHNYLLNGILHHNSGKDYTTVRTVLYVVYWLCCLKNPQEYFHIGTGTPIIISNMSINEEHAMNVFFKQFTSALKRVRNPATGKNFFAELGVDLRDGKDIQTRKVLFPNEIEAWAADSARYALEGKNVLLNIFDEIAEVRYDRAKIRYNNIKNTAYSRFPNYYKLIFLSYPRDQSDYMCTHFEEVDSWNEEDRKKVYKSIKAPWEVRSKKGAHPLLIERRLYKTKEDYAAIYRADPIEAMRRYECKFPKTGINKYLKKFNVILEKCVNFERPSPIDFSELDRENGIYLTEKELNNILWRPWFKPNYSYEAHIIEQKLLNKEGNPDILHKQLNEELEKHAGSQYFIHLDLSQGKKDCAGLALVHPYLMTPTQMGYYIDFAIQIRPEDVEINFEDIRKFIFKLDELGWDITKVSLDGYQSVDFTQIISRRGINTEIISVDRSRKPYDTLKGLLYQGKINMYNYLVSIRELKELIVTKSGKVDHPKESPERLKYEGLKDGSKDVSDAVCGAVYAAIQLNSDSSPSIVDASEFDNPLE